MTSSAPIFRTTLLAASLSGALLLAGCSGAGSNADDSAAAAEAVEVAGIEITVDETATELLPRDIAEAGSVKVATDAPYAPFEMFAEEGSDELTGVDVDLGRGGAVVGVRAGSAAAGEQESAGERGREKRRAGHGS